MKQIYVFSLALIFQASCLAANPVFYALDIRANNDALLHGTQERLVELAVLDEVLPARGSAVARNHGLDAGKHGGRTAPRHGRL